MKFTIFLQSIDILGTFVFALSGALAAVSKKMDLLGMLVLAIATAIGGGTLRSLMIGDTPVPFLQDPVYLIVCVCATIVVFFFHAWLNKLDKAILIFDAVGLGIFVISGVSIALQKGLSPWACVLMGVITGSFGGVIRDILTAKVPLIFQREIYATAGLLGAMLYFLLLAFHLPAPVCFLGASSAITLCRLLAVKLRWALPVV